MPTIRVSNTLLASYAQHECKRNSVLHLARATLRIDVGRRLRSTGLPRRFAAFARKYGHVTVNPFLRRAAQCPCLDFSASHLRLVISWLTSIATTTATLRVIFLRRTIRHRQELMATNMKPTLLRRLPPQLRTPVLYMDRAMMVLQKPPGLVSQEVKSPKACTLRVTRSAG